jgi:hypothetical protein
LPHAIWSIESGGIADRSGISVRRVNADTESKTGAIISSAAVISATPVEPAASAKGAPATVSTRRRGEGMAPADSAVAASESTMGAAATRRER